MSTLPAAFVEVRQLSGWAPGATSGAAPTAGRAGPRAKAGEWVGRDRCLDRRRRGQADFRRLPERAERSPRNARCLGRRERRRLSEKPLCFQPRAPSRPGCARIPVCQLRRHE